MQWMRVTDLGLETIVGPREIHNLKRLQGWLTNRGGFLRMDRAGHSWVIEATRRPGVWRVRLMTFKDLEQLAEW